MTGGTRHDGGVVVVSKGQGHDPSFRGSVLPSPKTKMAISPPTNSIYREIRGHRRAAPRVPRFGVR